ncbi:D-alanyl-D-alanine carboxypeptidase, partial [Escherichia coli]|nr:D-alanyl-D-alanine carboxypeptidase [Escherichia coli]
MKEKTIEAPVKKGTEVGKMEVSLKDGDKLGYVDGKQTETIDVLTASDVEKANWFMLSTQAVGSFFTGIGNYVSDGVKGWFN